MNYKSKTDIFLKKSARDGFRTKTDIENIPIMYTHGSSSHEPETKSQFQTSDIVLWVKFLNQWFRPYGGFNQTQIEKMVEVCVNDNQIISLMEMLSCKRE